MKPFFPLLLVPFLLFASDHRAGQSDRERHEEKRAYFLQERHKQEKSWWDGPHLTGDWGAARAALADAGITLASTFTTNIAGNPSGGRAQGFAYAGSYGLSLNVDFYRTGWEGLDLFCSAVWRTGTSLSMRKIDNQFPVQQVFGSQTVKLNELYFIQTLFEERLAIKAGRLDAGNDFFASPLYWRFMNNGFDGNPISIFFNVPFTAYPNSTWGAYLMAKPWKRLSAKFAVFNANSKIKLNKYHGANFTFKSTNGVIWITEWCALVNQEKEDRGMPGNYKAGFFYQTGRTSKFDGGNQNGDPCLYFLFDQMVYRKGQRGLTPFVSLVFMPKDRNLFPLFVNGGLVFKGLFPSRPQDAASAGYIYGKYSSDKASVDRSAGNEAQNFESIVELNYWAQINPWFYIMPDLQYIIHPKGLNIPNAFVIGAQIGIDLW